MGVRLNEGIALRWALTSQYNSLIRAISPDRERQRSPMGLSFNRTGIALR
jgi:hypothetical protein